ncbi:MAG: SOS response-associated peptidase family protein, partial [Rhizomicrobium sp.]
MCGKFTAMFSWSEVVAFTQPLGAGGADDREVTYRVVGAVPVIVLDIVSKTRRAIAMRWGFPDPKDWRRPRPIHARSETIDTTRAFAQAFADGQRGIVLMKSFNEAPDVPGPTVQHTITPDAGEILAAAFVWQKFEIAGAPDPFFACVLCTVPANELIARLPTDRMPAFLAKEDWGTWLGEIPAALDEVKACLRTVEGVRWTMAKEGKRETVVRGKPVV